MLGAISVGDSDMTSVCAFWLVMLWVILMGSGWAILDG